MEIVINNLNKPEQNKEQVAEILATITTDLDAFSEQIRTVDVVLTDINGPKGGCDQECTLKVKMKRHGTFFARVRGYDAFDAAREATYKVLRQLIKGKSLIRKRYRKARSLKSHQSLMFDQIA